MILILLVSAWIFALALVTGLCVMARRGDAAQERQLHLRSGVRPPARMRPAFASEHTRFSRARTSTHGGVRGGRRPEARTLRCGPPV